MKYILLLLLVIANGVYADGIMPCENFLGKNSKNLLTSTFCEEVYSEVEELGLGISIKNQRDFSEEFLRSNYENKIIYIDTRSKNLYKKEMDSAYEAAKNLASSIEDSGVVFLVKDQSLKESRNIINSILPYHNYSYNDGPFLIGYTNAKKNKKILMVELSGMSSDCLEKYFLDIEQAIVRGKLNNPETRKEFTKNSLLCEVSSVFETESYTLSIENIWKYLKSLKNGI